MNRIFGSPRFLAIYSGILTLVFAVTLLGGFAPTSKKTSLEELNVQRVNIVEPDGTLRMVLSSQALFPGIIIKGKEYPHESRKTAGMLFFNEEGTENGGLIFGGAKGKDGKGSSYGHLSFDEYDQDQYFTIDASHEGDRKSYAMMMIDRPNYGLDELMALTQRMQGMTPEQKQAEVEKFSASHPSPKQRLYLGRSPDKSVGLRLKDVDGKDRIVIQVGPDGAPVIRFLDPDGKVVSQLPAAPKQ